MKVGMEAETFRVGCVVCDCVAGHTRDRTCSRRRFYSNLRHTGSSVNLGWYSEHSCVKGHSWGSSSHAGIVAA